MSDLGEVLARAAAAAAAAEIVREEMAEADAAVGAAVLEARLAGATLKAIAEATELHLGSVSRIARVAAERAGVPVPPPVKSPGPAPKAAD